jgi:hypothetical protein
MTRKLLPAGLLVVAALGGVGVGPARAVDPGAVNKAIARGVALLRTMQRANGTWPHPEMGATALAGLTLLECGVPADDRAVARAAAAVREASLACTHTYSLSLGILFLDRLADPGDEQLIESMGLRLLAGQSAGGGWTYQCPPISADEARRLAALVRDRGEPAARRDPPAAGRRRTVNDLPREIQQQLALVLRAGPTRGPGGDDNSNTQFATLALWVARRYGLPTDAALTRIEVRFRSSQNPDGGWGYQLPSGGEDDRSGSSPSMTCAGLLGLVVVHGAVIEAVRDGNPRVKPRDLARDRALAFALAALSTAVGQPAGGNKDVVPPRAAGNSYYFLWSTERVCVALGLEALDRKDWYGWGAEVLLANQEANGSWRGGYADCGADTCFALLFLKRSNLVHDLTGGVKGKLQDPAEAVLRGGGFGGGGLRGKLKPGIDPGPGK